MTAVSRKSFLSLSIAYYLVLVLAYLKNLVIAGPIHPADFAIVVILRVVLGYTYFTDLGLINTMIRQLPMLLAKHAVEEAKTLRNAIFTLLLVCCTLVTLLIYGGVVLFHSKIGDKITEVLFVVPIIMILQQLYGYFVGILRAEGDFKKVAASKNLVSVIDFVVTATTIFFLGIRGIYLAYILSNVVGIVFLARSARIRPSLFWDVNSSKKLLTSGLGFFFYTIGAMLFYTMDKLVLSRTYTPELFGVYGFISMMLVQGLGGIADSLGTVMYTRFASLYGKDEKKADLLHLFNQSNLSLFLIVIPPLLCAIALFTNVAISFFLPKYAIGIYLMPYIIWLAFLQGIPVAGFFIFTINQHIRYGIHLLWQGLLCAVILYMLSKPAMPVTVLLLVFIAFYFLARFTSLRLVYRFLGANLKGCIRIVLLSDVPFALLFVLYYYLVDSGNVIHHPAELLTKILSFGILLVLYFLGTYSYLDLFVEGRALKKNIIIPLVMRLPLFSRLSKTTV